MVSGSPERIAELTARAEADLASMQRLVDTATSQQERNFQVTAVLQAQKRLEKLRLGQIPQGMATEGDYRAAKSPGYRWYSWQQLRKHSWLRGLVVAGALLHVFLMPAVFLPNGAAGFVAVWYIVGFPFWGWLLIKLDIFTGVHSS